MRGSDLRLQATRSPRTPAQRFVAEVSADPRASHCTFEIEDWGRSRTGVVLDWLEGGGGLVPWLTSVADKYGVTLSLLVDVHGPADLRLVDYYRKCGFLNISDDRLHDLQDDDQQLQIQIVMDRPPHQRTKHT